MCEVLATWQISSEPRRLLKIFDQGMDLLGPIRAPERELRWREDTIDPGSTDVGYIWPKTDVYWRSLVGSRVVSGYLVRINVSWGSRFPGQDSSNHRWELLSNYPVFTVLMVIYHYVDKIWRILITPVFCITYMIMNIYYPGEPVNIHVQSLINIIQDNNWVITAKRG